MNKILKEKISESVSSVLPITIIVLLLSVTITPMPVGTMVLFLTGAALLIVGMALFSLGTDVSMTPMGEGICSLCFTRWYLSCRLSCRTSSFLWRLTRAV